MSALNRVGGGVNRFYVGGLETGNGGEVGGGGLQCLLGPGGGGRCLGSLRTILQRQGGWTRVYHGSSVVSACRHLDCSTHVGVAGEGVEAEEEGGVEVAEEENGESRCVFLNPFAPKCRFSDTRTLRLLASLKVGFCPDCLV